jgi:penicillin-binding protein 1C
LPKKNKISAKKVLQKLAIATLCLFLLFLLTDWLLPFAPQPSYSKTIYDRHGRVLQSFLNSGQKWRLRLELAELNPKLEQAFLAKEDRYFYYHPGFNPGAILRATVQNTLYRRRTSGASTITMQVVRLLRPQARTYTHKLLEVFNAMQLEWHFSKKEILAMYFNLVPYGSNIEGVKAASLLYFQKNPDRLSLAEIATLCLIPNRPSSLRIGHNNAYIQSQRNQLLRKFARRGVFATAEIDIALAETLKASRQPIAKLAPHFCIKLSNSPADNLASSLDASIQHNTETLVQKYSQRLASLNIRNAAVIVVHNPSRQILAYVGSQNFADTQYAGQVDGVQAVRSPGSTLKPLLYGLAFDRGLATPKNTILDVPSNFDGYQPENFDQDYHGKVSYSYALANSLNIPAVKILDELGTSSLIETLKKCRFNTISRKSKDLGLSMVLGGCGVSLHELTALFAAIASQGRYQPLSYHKNQPPAAPTQILSPEASYLVTNILAQITRPDLPNNYSYTYRLPKIAWKTGTSFGKKDAWSIGYNPNYTVGVWLGNFDGSGVPELSGANTATPLLFEVFNTLAYNQNQWYRQPANLKGRLICLETGNLPTQRCQQLGTDLYLPGSSHSHTCNHLQRIYCSHSQRISYCTSCLPSTGADTLWLPHHTPELLGYYQLKKISYPKAYPHNPACSRIFESGSLRITFPVAKATYYLNKTENQKLSLSCQASAGIQKVYWYANNRLLGSCPPNQPFLYQPAPGPNTVFCLDQQSRSHQVSFQVKLVP